MPLAAVGSGVPRWLKAGEDRLEPGLQVGGRGGGGVPMMPLAAAEGSGVPRWLKAGEDRPEPGLQVGGRGGGGVLMTPLAARARPAGAAGHMENK